MRSQPAVRHVGLTWRVALAGVALLAALFGAGSAISALAQALAERNLPAPPSTAQMTPDEITARLGFTALWPTSLPPSLTWSGAEVGGPCRRADGTSIRTSGSFIALWRRNLPPALEPALRLQEEGCGGLLPDGRPITVRGLPGAAAVSAFSYRDRLGEQQGQEVRLAWVEREVRVVLSSRSLALPELLQIAAVLQSRAAHARYRVAETSGMIGQRVVVGAVDDFPIPSVTNLINLQVYLLRSSTGFIALLADDLHGPHPTGWSSILQLFYAPDHGEEYDWRGNCVGGPCLRGLDRYPVDVRGGQVVVDTTTRLPGPRLGPLADDGGFPGQASWP